MPRAPRKTDELRIQVLNRPLTVLAKTFVFPDCPFVAMAAKGPPDKTKVVASGYGRTEEEAREKLDLALAKRADKAAKAAAAARTRREQRDAVLV